MKIFFDKPTVKALDFQIDMQYTRIGMWAYNVEMMYAYLDVLKPERLLSHFCHRLCTLHSWVLD